MQRANPRTIGVCWLKKHKITTLSGVYFMDISYTIMDDTYIQYIYIFISLSLIVYLQSSQLGEISPNHNWGCLPV